MKKKKKKVGPVVIWYIYQRSTSFFFFFFLKLSVALVPLLPHVSEKKEEKTVRPARLFFF